MAGAYERQAKAFEGLQRSLAALADALERPLPALPRSTTRIAGAEGGVSLVTKQQVGRTPWQTAHVWLQREMHCACYLGGLGRMNFSLVA